MLITIEKILTAEQVAVARQKLATAEWIDGRVTAGYQAQEVKRNAREVNIPSQNAFVHAIIQHYYVDGQDGVANTPEH